MEWVYFDNAATSWPKPAVMMRAMERFNDSIGANPGRSGHRLSIDAARVLFDARERVAELLGAADPLEIVFTKNGTEALNLALQGLLAPGDHLVTTSLEHNSVMRPLRALERRGVELTIVPGNAAGELAPADLIKALRKDTRAIVLTHASNVTGTLLPLSEIAGEAKARGIALCVDAAQTAGSIPLDVQALGVDLLAFSGHKSLLGPQGTGGLFVSREIERELSPLLQGGTGSRSEFEEQPDFLPDKLEAGTPNTIGLAGLGASVGYLLERGVAEIRGVEQRLTQLFLDGARSLAGLTVHGNPDAARRTAVVSFNLAGRSPSEVAYALDQRFGILSRPGLHCAPAAHRTLGTFPQGTVRFSFGPNNTADEIARALAALDTLCQEAQSHAAPARVPF